MFFLGSFSTMDRRLSEAKPCRESDEASKNGRSSIGELGASKNNSSSEKDVKTVVQCGDIGFIE